MSARDTIVALASGHAAAGIGVVRLSGPQAHRIAQSLCARPGTPVLQLVPRTARYARFRAADGELIDDGLLLAFAAPRSFTGEDVVELQGHGNPRLLARLVERCVALGARRARPGEFSERAFLEGKLDLIQAEAVADLISAGSDAALRAARRSLDGAFSRRVEALVEATTALRVWLEAALDFPDEAIDFLAAPELRQRLQTLRAQHTELLDEARHGQRLRDGLHVLIQGAPNAGKSALLNALAGSERAIVTPIAGTTRDLLREAVCIEGIELTLVDSAGLRETHDPVEIEGIRRARAERAKADLVLAVVDDREAEAAIARMHAEFAHALPTQADGGAPCPVLWLHSHADCSRPARWREQRGDGLHLWLSSTTGQGLDALRSELRERAGQGEGSDGAFSARARHVEALERAGAHLQDAAAQLQQQQGELAAEDLRLAQAALGEITGVVRADQLLGRIFGSFCIGK